MTAVQSAFGTEGALRAMVTNEKLTNASYEAALHDVTDAELREVLQGHKDDEQRHLEYVQNALDHRLWERLEQTASV
jgi:rubrerythrin